MKNRLFYLINNLLINYINRTRPCKLINTSRCYDTVLAVSGLWVINYFKLSLDISCSEAALKSPLSLPPTPQLLKASQGYGYAEHFVSCKTGTMCPLKVQSNQQGKE